jgi:hypothetical protein
MADHPEVQELASDPLYLTDAAYHMEVKWLRQTLRRLYEAMACEAVPGVQQERIVSRMLYGRPDGTRARRERRERQERIARASNTVGTAGEVWRGD